MYLLKGNKQINDKRVYKVEAVLGVGRVSYSADSYSSHNFRSGRSSDDLSYMVEHCKGCGEELTNLHPALSRYKHGDICPSCGTLEALYGDFIGKYSDPLNIDFPKEYIDTQKDLII